MLPWFKFSARLRRLFREVRQNRFCIECGVRNLIVNEQEDRWKYTRGEVWSSGEKNYMRCLQCAKVDETTPNMNIPLCSNSCNAKV